MHNAQVLRQCTVPKCSGNASAWAMQSARVLRQCMCSGNAKCPSNQAVQMLRQWKVPEHSGNGKCIELPKCTQALCIAQLLGHFALPKQLP